MSNIKGKFYLDNNNENHYPADQNENNFINFCKQHFPYVTAEKLKATAIITNFDNNIINKLNNTLGNYNFVL